MKGSRKTFFIFFAAATIILLGLIIFMLSSQKNTGPSTSATRTNKSTPTPTPVPYETVMVTVHGFVPEILTVKKGTYINFANFSEKVIDIEPNILSAPANNDLKIGKIEVGSTSSPIKFSTPGQFSYYNKLIPEQKGTIVIQ